VTAITRKVVEVVVDIDRFHWRASRRLEKLNWSQEDLARQLGVNRTRVSQILNASTIPEPLFLRISALLGVGMDYWTAPMKPPAGVMGRALQERAVAISEKIIGE